MGKIQADDEKIQIARANRDTHAVNYHAEHKVREGNRLAKEKQTMEMLGLVQTSNAEDAQVVSRPEVLNDREKSSMTAVSKGTYGHEYEVKEYEVKDYKPGEEYQFTEYKSVYDS